MGATPHRSARNSGLSAHLGREGACVLSKGLCPLLRDGKLTLGYFQFPAPVLKLSGPFPSTSAGQTNLHFLAQPTLVNRTVQFQRADETFSFCCPTYNDIWEALILFLIFHTHMLPHSSFFPSLLPDM